MRVGGAEVVRACSGWMNSHFIWFSGRQRAELPRQDLAVLGVVGERVGVVGAGVVAAAGDGGADVEVLGVFQRRVSCFARPGGWEPGAAVAAWGATVRHRAATAVAAPARRRGLVCSSGGSFVGSGDGGGVGGGMGRGRNGDGDGEPEGRGGRGAGRSRPRPGLEEASAAVARAWSAARTSTGVVRTRSVSSTSRTAPVTVKRPSRGRSSLEDPARSTNSPGSTIRRMARPVKAVRSACRENTTRALCPASSAILAKPTSIVSGRTTWATGSFR